MREKDWQFKKYNQMWKLAQKPGRKKRYTPKSLLKKAIEYFEYCDNNPLRKMDAVRSGKQAGDVISIPAQRPYTEIGFYTYAGIDRKTFKSYSRLDEFLPVSTYILGVIKANQIEGAMVGLFNANIVARLQGLSERKTLEIARLLETVNDEDLLDIAETIVSLSEDEEV